MTTLLISLLIAKFGNDLNIFDDLVVRTNICVISMTDGTARNSSIDGSGTNPGDQASEHG